MHIDLKEIRQQNGGLTQTQLAEKLGIKLRTVQNYEKGDAIPEYMKKLIWHEFLADKTDVKYANSAQSKDISSPITNLRESLQKIVEEDNQNVRKKIASELEAKFQESEKSIEEFREKYYEQLEKSEKMQSFIIKEFNIDM